MTFKLQEARSHVDYKTFQPELTEITTEFKRISAEIVIHIHSHVIVLCMWNGSTFKILCKRDIILVNLHNGLGSTCATHDYNSGPQTAMSVVTHAFQSFACIASESKLNHRRIFVT